MTNECGDISAGWSTMSEREAWVRRFAALIAGARDELCSLMQEDMGKVPWEGLMHDVTPLLASCRWHEKRAARLLRERAAGLGSIWNLGQRHRRVRAPLGRVGIIATWNYPVQLLGVQLVQALMAGNRVVVKPSEFAARCQSRLMALAVEADLPEGVLTWTAATREAGAAMLREQRLDHVVFTGSTRVGREIAAWAAGTLTPTTLELSGRDSAIVLEDADPALAARSIWYGMNMNAGQTCMAPRRALVLSSVYDAFIRALEPLAASAKPVDLVNADAAAQVWDVARASLDSGGPARSLSGVAEAARGRKATALAIVDCRGDEEVVAGEHFGPLLAVVRVGSLEEALAIHDRAGQHLATSVFTRNVGRARALAARLGSGIVTINDAVMPSAHPGAQIAGRGESGWGASRGEAGLLAMTREVHVASTSRLIRPPLEEPVSKLVRRISGFVGWWYGARASGGSNTAMENGVTRPEGASKSETANVEVRKAAAESRRQGSRV